MVTLARINYASRMVDAIDPARLDRLPADVQAAFEAQAKAPEFADDKARATNRAATNALLRYLNGKYLAAVA